MGYGGGGSGSGGSGGGTGGSGGSGYRRVGDDRTANLKVDNITSRQGGSDGKRVFTGAFSNSVRGIFYGGTGPGSPSTTEQTCIQYITISTTGNSLDFGDLTSARSTGACCSNAHGGL